MSKRFPYFPFFAEDFASGCRKSGMSPDLVGMFIAFLAHQWDEGGPIPANPERLRNALGWSKRTIASLLPRLVQLGKISYGEGMLWNDRLQGEIVKNQGAHARKSPPKSTDPVTEVFAIFAVSSPRIRRELTASSPPVQRELGGNSAGIERENLEFENNNNDASRHTRVTTSNNHFHSQEGEESSVAARAHPPAVNEASTSGANAPRSSGGLFTLDEQGAGLVRNGSAFKWLDPKTGEARKLTFQFIERLAPQEPRAILLDFAETELIAAIDSGREGGLHGLIRHAIDKGRLATFKRRPRVIAAVSGDDEREPEAAAPITEGSWG